MRKSYLDNIRWITVVLVVVYHVLYMFNSVETAGVIGALSSGVQYQDMFLYIVYPWFMVLLFVVSGMTSRYYLEQHSGREFISSRTRKLLVPSTIGLFVFWWIMGYYNMLIGGAFEYMGQVPKAVLYLIMCISGTGPLWFIQLLWIFGLILLLIRKAEKDRLYHLCAKANTIVLVLMTVLIWASAQVLNTPLIIVYRFGIYGVSFLIGYFILSHEEVMEKLERAWLPLCAAALILMIVFCIVFWQKPYAEHSVLNTPLCNAYAWIAVLAILAFMHRFGNFDNAFARFMNRQSWGLYIFHYLPLAVCAWQLRNCAEHAAPIVIYTLTGAAAFAGSFALYAVISRIPLLRWCVLGIKREKGK